MTLAVVNAGMTLSVVLFLSGYFYRKRNNRLHRILMGSAVAANLLSAVFLVFSVHVLYAGSMIAAGFQPVFSPPVVLTHRIVASLTALLMLVQAWSGITRRIALHRRLHFVFLPLYLGVYVSGLIIFQSPEGAP